MHEMYQKAVDHYNAGRLEDARVICDEILGYTPHGDSYNLLAHIADKKGEHEESITLMHKALALYKTSPTYNNNLGNILFKLDRFAAAADSFRKAVLSKPDFAKAHFNLGFAESKCGNYEKALCSFERAIELSPDLYDAYINIGNIYKNTGKQEEAVKAYTKALKAQPANFVASVNMSLALQALGNMEEAEKMLTDALLYSPANPEILFNLGNIHKKSDRIDKAVECYEMALKAAPEDARIHYNLGTTLMEARQYSEAMPCFEKALELTPDNTEALNNMGMVHYRTGLYQNALTYYQRAIDIREDFAEAHNNIGLVYKLLEQKDKSLRHFNRAIEIDPEFGEAFHNLSEVQRESKQFDVAIENSRRAIELQPDLTPALTHHSYLLKWLCEWDEYDHVKERIDLLVKRELDTGEVVGETPFMNLIRVDDPQYNRRVADYFAGKALENIKNIDLHFSLRDEPRKLKKITVGYLSANFRYHPLAHLLANLFRHHNRNEFQINCYSMGPDDKSEYRARFEKDSDLFRDIRHFSHKESAQLIYDDNVEILVDLMGYTQGNRLEIAALRPAPLQVRYMGMPGTTGGNIFDYIIVDEIVLPIDQQTGYSEKFIYMPHTYQVNDRSKQISREPVTRKMFDLPEDAFVFCSFNTSYKVDPVIFSAWMEILNETENSVLWLMPDIKRAGDNMRSLAKEHGVDPKRLIYTNNIPLEKHLARISLADLALDTRTVGGAATTSDALWGGIPVITLLGNRFISRMSASILHAAGLDELITHTLSDYKKLAIKLAADRDEVKALKKKLQHNIQSMPLFDTLGFTLNLERAFKKVWESHISGKKPQPIDLKQDMNQLRCASALYCQEYDSPLRRISIN